MKHFQILLSHSIMLSLMCCVLSCSIEQDQDKTTIVKFQFDISANGEPLVFESKKYKTQSDQLISLERIKLYLSNIKLIGDGGDEFIEPDSYHLISFDVNHGSFSVEIENVPSKMNIQSIQFSIGVDSEANSSIDHIGDLDPTNGMSWDWNTGYKFFLLEGRYFDSDELGEEIKMHIGTDKNYQIKVYDLDQPQSQELNYTFYFDIDALSVFSDVDLSEGTVFMNDSRGDKVAENYKAGFISLSGYEYYGL